MSIPDFKCYQRGINQSAEQEEFMMNSQKTSLIGIVMYLCTMTRHSGGRGELLKAQILVFKDLGSLGGRLSVKVLLTWVCFSVVQNFGMGRKVGACYKAL